eukprot:CAMPEP_0115870434 /NCGR_PEP_ID=MMETSP0287-20121206/22324_1 /TAXON_ID=412157 /ORGANISM="Chrysochromulina rotalis, Strain UIO044" /LENGTH=92 /DNA_ID=CAMNT_0003325155 /DNA_START=278 /DNA_END=557 /DNA_ORIENTATION=-
MEASSAVEDQAVVRARDVAAGVYCVTSAGWSHNQVSNSPEEPVRGAASDARMPLKVTVYAPGPAKSAHITQGHQREQSEASHCEFAQSGRAL